MDGIESELLIAVLSLALSRLYYFPPSSRREKSHVVRMLLMRECVGCVDCFVCSIKEGNQ